MSETAAQVIKDALLEIGGIASESPLEADEVSDAIRYMNNFMFEIAALGINLGYTEVSTLADVITIPPGALSGLKSNLAISLIPQYAAPGTPISLALAAKAENGMNAMRSLAIFKIGPTAFPDTLPMGSGNEDGFAGCDSHFYSGDQDHIETEQGGFIATEDSTNEP